MAIYFSEIFQLTTNDEKILLDSAGDILVFIKKSLTNDVNLDLLREILNSQTIKPIYEINVLNNDETVSYNIPNDDIIDNGISYNEGYQNGERRSISLKLINVKDANGNFKYLPNAQGLWYGVKIGYNVGFEYQGVPFLIKKGIYIINSFDLINNISAKEITYELKDKFSLFSSPTGTLDAGYEIPVGTPIESCLQDLLNLSCSDNTLYDIKDCILDNSYSGFKTQQTIRIDEGQHMSDLIDQLAVQMSAEYYYNSMGHLIFYPLDNSMNDIDKPILWTYDEVDLNGLEIKALEDIVNVVSVTGTNVNGKISSAISRNENLSSPVNIYQIKERRNEPITDANVWSTEMAQELADYTLRNKTLYQLSQNISVPLNPLLTVNNLIEINNDELHLYRTKWLIKSISYTSGSDSMNMEISSLDYLPFMNRRNYKDGK